MKKLILPLSLLSLLMVSSCNMANDTDYDAMAGDLCGCISKPAKKISPEMQAVIIKAVDENKDLEGAMTEHMTNNMEQGMKDAEALMQLAADVETCTADLEKKYNDVYTTETEKEVLKKMLQKLDAKDGCEFSSALMKLGEKEMNK